MSTSLLRYVALSGSLLTEVDSVAPLQLSSSGKYAQFTSYVLFSFFVHFKIRKNRFIKRIVNDLKKHTIKFECVGLVT